jgi:hypothetical protein
LESEKANDSDGGSGRGWLWFLGDERGSTGKSGKGSDDKGITTFWQYFTKGWKNFNSPWFVKGKGLNPPYKLGEEARKALYLPKGNKATDVRPYYPDNIVGPRKVRNGTGLEFYDGDEFLN